MDDGRTSKVRKLLQTGRPEDVRQDNAAHRHGSASGYLRIGGAGLGFRGEQFQVSSFKFRDVLCGANETRNLKLWFP